MSFSLILVFIIILNTGTMPKSWMLGKIIPIYKKKGKVNDPSNYWGITLLTCFGKLSTSVINNRLQMFVCRP